MKHTYHPATHRYRWLQTISFRDSLTEAAAHDCLPCRYERTIATPLRLGRKLQCGRHSGLGVGDDFKMRKPSLQHGFPLPTRWALVSVRPEAPHATWQGCSECYLRSQASSRQRVFLALQSMFAAVHPPLLHGWANIRAALTAAPLRRCGRACRRG